MNVKNTFNTFFYLVLGVAFAGTILDAISNSITLLNFRLSIAISISISILWITAYLWVKRFNPRWEEGGRYVRIKKLNKKVHLFFVGILLIIWVPFFAIVSDVKKKENNANAIECNFDPIFQIEDTLNFKILLLPFSPTNDCEYQSVYFENILSERFEDLILKDHLKIAVKVVYPPKCIITMKEAFGIGVDNNVNMVIWGVYDEKCKDNTKINLKFVLINQSASAELNENYIPECLSQKDQETIDTWYKDLGRKAIENSPMTYGDSGMQELDNLYDLNEGYLQADLDYLFYYINAIVNFSINDYAKAIESIKKIKHKDKSLYRFIGRLLLEKSNVQNIDPNNKIKLIKESIDYYIQSNESVDLPFKELTDKYNALTNFEDFICYLEKIEEYVLNIPDRNIRNIFIYNLIEQYHAINFHDSSINLSKKIFANMDSGFSNEFTWRLVTFYINSLAGIGHYNELFDWVNSEYVSGIADSTISPFLYWYSTIKLYEGLQCELALKQYEIFKAEYLCKEFDNPDSLTSNRFQYCLTNKNIYTYRCLKDYFFKYNRMHLEAMPAIQECISYKMFCKGQYQLALSYINSSINIGPKNVNPMQLIYRSTVYFNLRKYSLALEDMNNAKKGASYQSTYESAVDMENQIKTLMHEKEPGYIRIQLPDKKNPLHGELLYNCN